jgi:peptidyl-prolyl cis-trans isomerase B (cyclophilin B)
MNRRASRLAFALVALLVAACSSGSTGGAGAASRSTPSPIASASIAPSGTGASSVCPTQQPAPLAAGETRTVTIATDKGTFAIKVEGKLSPIAAGNFVALAACGFYDSVVFHRVATLDDGTPFVIQGGDPTGTGRGGPGYTIKDEPVTATYKRGTVAMARTAQPDSVGSQFFIVLDDRDAPILSQYNTYQIIGSVSSGMETVDAIYAAANGQELPADPVHMTKLSVANP